MKEGDATPSPRGRETIGIWGRLTEPSPQLVTTVDQRGARFLASILLLVVPAAMLLSFDWHRVSSDEAHGPVVGLAALVVAYALSRTRHYRVGAWVGVIAVTVTSFTALLSGGSDLQIGFMGLSVVFAGVLLGARSTVFVTLANLGLVAVWLQLDADARLAGEGRLFFAFFGFLGVLVVLGVRHRNAIEADRREQLEASEQRYRGVFDTTFAGFASISEGKIVEANAGFAEIFGYPLGELAGKPIEELIAVGSRRAVQSGLAGSFSAPREVRGVRRDGAGCHLEFVASSQRGPGGTLRFFAVRDLTRRKQIEARLSLVDRAASIGTLAAGVAHQINNPLQYMVTNLGYLKETLPAPSGPATSADRAQAVEAVERALEGAGRVKKIVRDLRELSQPTDDQPGPTDVHDALELACHMVSNEIRARARLVEEYGDIPLAHGSRARLGQVFLNLLTNAFQALPESDPENNEIRIATAEDDDGCIRVTISDTGAGMSRGAQRRVFEPFYTTKSTRNGTGLGLAITRAMVTGLGGSVRIESELNKGTTVTVSLRPAEAEDVQGAGDGRSGTDPAFHIDPVRILVIDDEVDVGRSIERALARHDVQSITSGREALELCGSNDYDVIFCDLMMPELSGMDFFERLQTANPELARRVVFISGGTFTPRAIDFVDEVENRLLEKPFSVTELREAVSRIVLATKAGSSSVA